MFGNGADPDVRAFGFNTTVEYPEDPERKGYDFEGWNSTVDLMPAHDLAIGALWVKQKRSVPITTIVIVSMCVLLFIVVIVLSSVILLRRVRGYNSYLYNKRGRGRELVDPLIGSGDYFRSSSLTQTSDSNFDGSVFVEESALAKLYTQDYARPTLRDALLQADLTESEAELVCSACEDAARVVKDGGRLIKGFSEEDAAAVAMYTYDFGPGGYESNPYRIINRSLGERNYAELQKARGLLYLVVSAVRKLPRYWSGTLYRGVRGEVNLDEEHYHEGNVVKWTALSSTSPDMGATKAFLAKGSKSGRAAGTLFAIEGGWGYNVQPYSLFPDEIEILLEPERLFRVKSVISGDGLTIINLRMLDTPLSLPEVFGEGKEY